MAFAIAAIVGASVAAAGGLAKLGMSLGGRKARIQEQKDAKEAMSERMTDYENLDTSNLKANVSNKYADIQTNFENVYEDLTVNTKQAEFEGQQNQQSQANILSSLSGAAGSSGIAALAQSMANQGQLQAQRSSASIGTQEAMNQRLLAQGASAEQELESRAEMRVAQGEEYAEGQRLQGAETARGLEYSKTGTLLGMSQQRAGAANQARAQAKAQQMGAIGNIAGAGMQMATAGMKMGAPGGGGGLEGGGFSDPEFNQTIGGGITGPTIGGVGQTKFKDYSNLDIYGNSIR